MWWVLNVAFVAVPCAAAAALAPRSKKERKGFPWFWLVFPVTCLATGVSISGLLPGLTPLPGTGSVRYEQGRGASFDLFTVLNWLYAISAMTVVVGGILSAWAWRRHPA